MPANASFSKRSGMNSWKQKHLCLTYLWKSSSPPRFFRALWDELLKAKTPLSKFPLEILLPHPLRHTQTSLSWTNLSFALVLCYSLWDKRGDCSWIGHSLWRGLIHTGPWFVTLALAEVAVAEVTGRPELRIESRHDTLLTIPLFLCPQGLYNICKGSYCYSDINRWLSLVMVLKVFLYQFVCAVIGSNTPTPTPHLDPSISLPGSKT